MSRWRRVFWLGTTAAVRAELERALGDVPIATTLAPDAGEHDLAVIEAAGQGAASLPGGNAFSGCRALKQRPGLAVHVVVRIDDPYGNGLARFALADAVLAFDPAAGMLDVQPLDRTASKKPRRSIDALLARVAEPEPGTERTVSALQRLLQFERDGSLLESLQDPETGLFDGPYASLKLDEEWKRAVRFHQPLTLLLLDVGDAVQRAPDVLRRQALAEAAGVFLNECRDIDVLSRFTATTFLFLLPGTGSEGAAVLARRMLAALQKKQAEGLALAPCCGLATVPATGVPDAKSLLLVAEACLRRARAGGGDGGLCTSWE